jgi:hypothetical protein
MTAELRSIPRCDEVAAVMVVRGEPVERLQRVLDALAQQVGVDAFTVVIAAPAIEHRALDRLHVHGAVRGIVFVDNLTGCRSAGLNAAIAATAAEVVVRVDARSIVAPTYVARCIARLRADPGVGVVGGRQRPIAVTDDVRSRSIARALRNRWLLGNAAYRRTDVSGPVDTVYLGAFRREEVLGLGGYDEDLDANEDFEVCVRYRTARQLVWLEEDLAVDYEPRTSLREIGRQYHAFGASKVRYWRHTGRRPSARQWGALAGAAACATAAAVTVRRPRRLAALLAAGAVGLAVLDHASEPTERDPRVRAGACVTNVVIAASWLAGIASETLAPSVR